MSMTTIEQQIMMPGKDEFDSYIVDDDIDNTIPAHIIKVLQSRNNIFNETTLCTHLAAYYGKSKMLHQILKKCINREAEDKFGRTIAHYAAAGGRVNILKYCYDSAINISKLDMYHNTIVHVAAEYNKVNVLEYANEMNLPFNQESKSGTPLIIACQKCNFRVVEYLCRLGKEKIHPDFVFNNLVAILMCLRNNFFEAVPLISRAGANLNIHLFSSWTCLHFAVQANRAEFVEILLTNGADPNVCDSLDWYPLHIAAQTASPEIVRLLLEAGAYPAVNTRAGTTPYQIARNRFDSEAKEQILHLLRIFIVKNYVDNIIITSAKQVI